MSSAVAPKTATRQAVDEAIANSKRALASGQNMHASIDALDRAFKAFVGEANAPPELSQALRNDYPLVPPQKANRVFKAESAPIEIDPIFKHAQGSPEFLDECLRYLEREIKARRIGCPSASDAPKAMVYQKTIAKLYCEQTPIRRLLVVAQLGSGKTLMMLKILNNYINCKVAKILIFPTQATVANFYDELFKFKNHHRTWLEKQTGWNLSGAVDATKRARCLKLLWSPPAQTIAPLRAYRVTQFRTLMADKSIFGKRNVYEPLFIVDEIHNLVAPSKQIASRSNLMANLKRMAKFLFSGVVAQSNKAYRLVGLTATPIVDRPEQGLALLRLVKGVHNEHAGNHGFLTWYMSRDAAVFAKADAFPGVVDVRVGGEPLRAAMRANNPKSIDRYLHTSVYFANSPANVARVAANAETLAPKLDRIAFDIQASGLKTVVLVERANGLHILAAILAKKYKLSTVVFAGDVPSEQSAAYAAHRRKMEQFNSSENDRGELKRVAVCDSATYSEGVSFKSVRLVVLASVADKYGLMQQRLGRALRSCSHERLPPAERTLTQRMYCIKLEPTYESARGNVVAVRRERSPDELALEKLLREKPLLERAMCELARFAADRGFLAVRDSCTSTRETIAMQNRETMRVQGLKMAYYTSSHDLYKHASLTTNAQFNESKAKRAS
ncbi:hypothetical protein T492DRAFT_898548 [Pavlovales sp. CCMP2436]|nr:hypothetical protein T492DRAFT_898548 [Pavlovales sp. CCMP2436]